jgi:hypothetical protein
MLNHIKLCQYARPKEVHEVWGKLYTAHYDSPTREFSNDEVVVTVHRLRYFKFIL